MSIVNKHTKLVEERNELDNKIQEYEDLKIINKLNISIAVNTSFLLVIFALILKFVFSLLNNDYSNIIEAPIVYLIINNYLLFFQSYFNDKKNVLLYPKMFFALFMTQFLLYTTMPDNIFSALILFLIIVSLIIPGFISLFSTMSFLEKLTLANSVSAKKVKKYEIEKIKEEYNNKNIKIKKNIERIINNKDYILEVIKRDEKNESKLLKEHYDFIIERFKEETKEKLSANEMEILVNARFNSSEIENF